ncbi:MAG: hypothetical protein QM817_23765 [Archangium sp.]
MRLGLIAIALLALGAALTAYFVHRGPSIDASPRALTWSRFTPDAGGQEVDATWFGIDFVRLRDADEPVLEAGALRRGEEWIVFDDINCFDQFVPVDGGVWVVGEWCTEGGGPAAELFFLSADGSATKRATLPKPIYFATIRELTVRDETLQLRMEVDLDATAVGTDEGVVALPDEWVFPPWRVEPLTRFRPTVSANVLITSKNGGRTWRMDRHAAPP